MITLSEKLLLVGGMIHIGFAVLHIFFWRLFHWDVELAWLSKINREAIQIFNLCLIFVFLVIAYVSFFHSRDMLGTPLGKTLLVAFSLFWLLRMLEQIVFFGLRTAPSIAYTFAFLATGILYLLPAIA